MQDVGPVYALMQKFECERLGEDYLDGGALVNLKVSQTLCLPSKAFT